MPMNLVPNGHGPGHAPAVPYIVHCIEDLVSGARCDAIPGRLEGDEIVFDRDELLALLLRDLQEHLQAEPDTFAQAIATWLCSNEAGDRYAS